MEKPGEYALEPHFALWRLTCTLVLTGWIRLHQGWLANGWPFTVGAWQMAAELLTLLDWDSCVCVFPLKLSHRGGENAQPLERLT